MAERIEAAAERLPNLELLPPRPRSELLEEMRDAVAVVKTSRVEGMPNAFLEAWARGVPVLSLNVDPDAKIANNDIGVAADGSMERLIEAAASLWRDPAAAVRDGRACPPVHPGRPLARGGRGPLGRAARRRLI